MNKASLITYLENMSEKEGFFAWLFISSLLTLCAYILVIVVLRIYNQKTKFDEEVTYEQCFGPENFFNSVMEIIVTNTCIFGALYLYKETNPILETYLSSDFSSIILLALVGLSIVVNNIIDTVWLDKEWMKNNKYPKSSLRLAASIIVLLIVTFAFLAFKSTHYISIITLMLSLVLGRFVFFDSSLNNFKKEIMDMLRCWKSILLAIALIAIVGILGALWGIIEKENAIETIFLANIFYLIATNAAKKAYNTLTNILPN